MSIPFQVSFYLLIFSTLALGWASVVGVPIYAVFLFACSFFLLINFRMHPWLVLAALLYVLLSFLILSSGAQESLAYTLNIVAGMLTAFAAYRLVADRVSVAHRIFWVYLVIQFFALILGVAQAFLGIGYFLDTQYVSEMGHSSPAGFSSMQYAFARNYFPLISLFFAYLIIRLNRGRVGSSLRRLSILCGVIGLLGIGVSNSRSAILALISAVLIYMAISGNVRKIVLSRYFIPLLVCISAIVLVVLSVKPIFLDGEATYNSYSRLILWSASFSVFLKNPFFGVGAGEIREALEIALSGSSVVERMPHNIYLQLLAETGLFGFALFSIPFLLVFKKLFQSAKTFEEGDIRVVKIAIIFYFLIFGIDAFFHNHLNDNSYWIFLGMGVALARKRILLRSENIFMVSKK